MIKTLCWYSKKLDESKSVQGQQRASGVVEQEGGDQSQKTKFKWRYDKKKTVRKKK